MISDSSQRSLRIQAEIGSLAWKVTELYLPCLFLPLLPKPFSYAHCCITNSYFNSDHRKSQNQHLPSS